MWGWGGGASAGSRLEEEECRCHWCWAEKARTGGRAAWVRWSELVLHCCPLGWDHCYVNILRDAQVTFRGVQVIQSTDRGFTFPNVREHHVKVLGRWVALCHLGT